MLASLLRLSFAALLASLLVLPVNATNVPSGGKQLLPNNPFRQMSFKPANDPSRLVHNTIRVDGSRFDRAMRVRTNVTPDMPYHLSLTVPIDGAIDQRKTYLLDVWIRCPQTADEAGVGRFNLVVEQNKPHWAKVVQKRGTAGREWRRILHPFKPRRSLPEGEAHFAVHLGQSFAPTVFDFAQVRLWEYPASVEPRNLPTTTYSYPGRERDAPWRAEAQRRIREHRMSRADIRVVNAAGRPVTDVKVTARMQSHAFRFGTAVQATLIGMEEQDFPYRKQARISGGLSEWDWTHAQKYREILRKYFNRVVFEGAFRPWVYYNNDRRREAMYASLPWLEEHGLDVRGHFLTLGLIKGQRVDKWGNDPEGYKREMFRYIEDVVPRLGNRISEWDVIGHPVTGEPDLPDLVQDPDIHTEIMRRTR